VEIIKGFKLNQIPVHKIVIVATSEPADEMNRTIVIEDYPRCDDYTVVSGWHCSCYGFDNIKWEAVVYSADELKKLAEVWANINSDSEGIIAPLILNYLGD